jgi:hypothetical protein
LGKDISEVGILKISAKLVEGPHLFTMKISDIDGQWPMFLALIGSTRNEFKAFLVNEDICQEDSFKARLDIWAERYVISVSVKPEYYDEGVLAG